LRPGAQRSSGLPDPPGALLRLPFRRVYPPKIGLALELGDVVPEGRRLRPGLQRCVEILRQVLPLRPLGPYLDADSLSDLSATLPSPHWRQHDQPVLCLDDRAELMPIHRARNAMPRFPTPRRVRIER